MINLCLVVIATQFSVTKQREQRLMEEQRLRFKSNDSTLASYSPPGNCYEEMLKYISHLCRKSKRRINRSATLMPDSFDHCGDFDVSSVSLCFRGQSIPPIAKIVARVCVTVCHLR